MKNTVWNRIVALLLGLVLSLGAPALTQAQCTMCKTQVEASRQEKDGYDTTGLNKGILYLMAIPYVLIGTVGYFWYRHSQKRKAAAHVQH